MSATPASVSEFLKGRRIAVTGVSRDGQLPANAIYRRLKSCGYDVVPVNPKTAEVEGTTCYADVASVPGPLDSVMVASPPASGVEIVRACADRGVRHVWFHRSLGDGSVSEDAVRECRTRGIEPIVGGCPLMFCGKVDVFHGCMRWLMQRTGRVPR
jgi:predicted CoA-binding protein